MRIKLSVLLLSIVIMASFGCIESRKTPEEAVLSTPSPVPAVTEQELPDQNRTEPLKINDTFETWSRGYWSNLSYNEPYFRVITEYSEWNEFLEDQGYFAWLRGDTGMRLEGQLHPGLDKAPKTIRPDDFDKYFIIAAMMGLKNYAEGPEIEIENISRENNIVKVTVRWYDRKGGAAVQSAPYHIVIARKELLPAGNSTFRFIDTGDIIRGKLEVRE